MRQNSERNSRSKSVTGNLAGGRKDGQISVRVMEVRHLDSPPRITKPKSIHARRLLPFVPEGEERDVHSLSPRAFIARLTDAGPQNPITGRSTENNGPDIQIALNTPLSQWALNRTASNGNGSPDIQIALNTPLSQPALNRTASNVGEPSVSINDDVVLFTGNWYASVSTDGGKTFQFIDPNSMAQASDPPGVTFCCDQVANYMPSIDTFMWLMQYGPRTGDNIQRLAFATTGDVKTGRWHIFDITTEMLGIPGFFMDFPDLSVGASFIYITTNCFGPDGTTVGSAVVRIPFSSIQAGKPTFEKFVSMKLFAFRVAQNCGDTAYFAAHKDTSLLSVFSWPENQSAPASKDIPVARWIGTNGYISRTPDGRRWLDRADPRLTGATLAGNELWFSWGVDAGSNHRPQPFVQMARINVADMTLLEDVNLFDTDSAICYAGLSTNANNEVGVSYMIGGAVYPSHVVGIMSGDRVSVVAGKGDRGPLPDSRGHFDWGDYLTVRPVFRSGKSTRLFAATGYSFLGNKDGDDLDATPRFVIFGRAADVAADGVADGSATQARRKPHRGAGAGGSGIGHAGGGSGPHAGSGPITDVNPLPTVSSSVAAQIKVACGVHAGAQSFAQPGVAQPALVTKPGKERWPVKTGQDPDRDAVGKNLVNGQDLGAGIVPATVEEVISMPRPAGMENASIDPPAFQSKRAGTAETTIWRVEGNIIVLNQESDGDYHLVVQGASGATLVAEVPTPTTTFIGDSPWLGNIQVARQAVDDKLVRTLSPKDFVLPPGGKKLVPRNSLSGDFPLPVTASFNMPESFLTPGEGEQAQMPTFQTAVKPTAARITGVGFFDRAHGATGAAPNVFELHPVLKIEWL